MGCNCDTKCSLPGVNVGVPDRIIRGGLAAALVAVGLRQRGAARLVSLGLAGAVGVTAAIGHCWFYDLIGVNTAGECECGEDCRCDSDERGGCCGHEH